MITARFAMPTIGSLARTAMVPRVVAAAVMTGSALLGSIAWAQGTFRLGWDSCAPAAPNSVLDVCTTGGTLVVLVTPSVDMSGSNLEALMEISTGGPPVPNYILNCVLQQPSGDALPFFTHATCLAADRLLASGNTSKIIQVRNPVDGDASRVQFRMMANRKINQGKALTAGHEYQAFAINFPPGDPSDPDCEGCDVPFRVYVVQDPRQENSFGPHYGMGLRAQLPPGPGCPVPVFMVPSPSAPCISGNAPCNAPLAVGDRPRPDALGLSCAPNPTRDALRVSYELPVGSHVDLFVADLAGRSVRRLESGARSPGVHALTWDGRDELGRTVSPGVYWVTLRAEGRRSAFRVVMSR